MIKPFQSYAGWLLIRTDIMEFLVDNIWKKQSPTVRQDDCWWNYISEMRAIYLGKATATCKYVAMSSIPLIELVHL